MCPFVRKGTFFFNWRYFITSLHYRQFVHTRKASSSNDIHIIQGTLHGQSTPLEHMSIDERNVDVEATCPDLFSPCIARLVVDILLQDQLHPCKQIPILIWELSFIEKDCHPKAITFGAGKL
jgi:hypothetical protein